jgi:hypothetical protein
MRPRFLISTLVLVLTIIVIIFFLRSSKLPNEREAGLESPVKSIQPISRILLKTTNANDANQTTALSQTPPLTNDRQKTNIIRQYMESQNVPVDFIGKVIDQKGEPLFGAKIQVRVRHWDVVVPTAWGADTKEIQVESETDLGGRFELSGVTGDGFDIESIQKDGYEAEPGLRIYNAIDGSLERPVIFKMWKTNIHEQLVTGDKRFHIVPDGRPYIIHLMKGTIAESGEGDLKVWVKRPDSIVFGQRYDWSCEVDVVNGGLLEEDNRYSSMFSAPGDGYVDIFQFKQEIGGGWGDSTGAKRFYVKLSNGREYGRISIELFAYYNDQIPGMIHLQYAINPSGSRILKP